MVHLKEVSVAAPRPLPVLVLADASRSMSGGGKIEALNAAVDEMIRSFAEEDDVRARIEVAVIAFGGNEARVHLPLTPAPAARFMPLPAVGGTPLGAALDLAARLLEDRAIVPSRSYLSTVVLVSDGQPTDSWEAPLARLHDGTRAGRALRLAMGIGADADLDVLRRFLRDPGIEPFCADEARSIRRFFRWVTFSVTQRSRSAQPNERLLPPPDYGELLGDF